MALPTQTCQSPTVVLGAYPALRETGALGDISADITKLQQALHDIAYSISLAKKTGQTQAAAMLQQQYDSIKAQVDALVQQAQGQEAAPTLFSRIGDFQTWAQQIVSGAGKAISSSVKAVETVAEGTSKLGVVLPLAGLAVAGWFLFGRRRR